MIYDTVSNVCREVVGWLVYDELEFIYKEAAGPDRGTVSVFTWLRETTKILLRIAGLRSEMRTQVLLNTQR